ncbi:MAG: ECF transporter S component [Oscillospiraceae bacterium]|nr:ECF transporter S component [Clostridiaceae bacterium]MDY5889262.1 ECF transporter S component [Oscillospiraceae bacterium]MDY5934655.1 ECF transporter S component [Oscillospiraceae bacterium]
MNTKKKNLRMIAVTAIMSALSAVLMFVEFSIPIMPAFIKLDVSELPALITSFTFGPVCGVAVCLVKNLIHLFVTSTFGVGELSNFILGAIFVFVAGMFYKHKHNRKYALIGAMAGDLAMAVLCFFVNLFFVYPLYIKLMLPEEAILGMYRAILPSVDSLWKAILIFNVPFTFVKGLISVAITFIVYPKLSPILKGKK